AHSSAQTAMTSVIDPLFAADQGDTRGVLMIIGGKVVAKRYGAGYSDQTRLISWSMAKTITAVLIGELVADGKLKLDAPVPFAEWSKPGDPRGQITLRNMLNMASGLDHTEGLNPKDGAGGVLKSDTSATLFVDGTDNMVVRNIAKSLEAKPGSKFEYSSMTSLLLAELITRQLTDSKDPRARATAYKSFADARLFKPAGIGSAVMDFDGRGTQIGGSIIYMNLDDWGRFGQVMLSGNGVDGKPIIAPEWLAFMTTASANDGGYGGHTWLNRPRPVGADPALFPGQGPETLYSAVGHLGQYVIASPDQDMVFVRLGKTNDGDLEPVRKALGAIVASVPLTQAAQKRLPTR
ncbi:MAG: serine hydrolase domain-containing protein, partial [Sphingomonadaceae bacterium]